VNAHSALTRLDYWDAGTYRLDMKVHTSRPTRVFEKSWTFTLTQQEADSIRLNAIPMLRQIAGFEDIPFNFAYPAYVSPSDK
jgi:hypothetical protein